MDPVTAALVNLGGGFALAAVLLLLHREALKTFREELAAERTQNMQQQAADRGLFATNLSKLFDKMDALNNGFSEAKCRAPYPPQHKPT